MNNERPEVEVVVPRHAPDCIFKRNPNRLGQCRCPKYLYVRRERIRISAKTRSWDIARRAALVYANRRDPATSKEQSKNTQNLLLGDAIEKFYASLRAGSTGEKTIANIRADCQQLAEFMAGKIVYVHEIPTQLLTTWMAQWKGRAKLDRHGQPTEECTLTTKSKKRKHIRRFFEFCLANHWIEQNPADGMPKIARRNQPSAIPKIPFTREQMTAIMKAAREYHNHKRAILAHAFIGVMRRSGIGIADATRLERTRLQKDNRLELYRTKTGEPVYLPLPTELANELRALEPAGSRYFFWDGNGKWESASNGWAKVLRPIFRAARIKMQDRYGNPLRPSSHFFRNTFAKEILETGRVTIDQLATLMADNPKTVREYYAKWVPDLQNQLDEAVKSAWTFRSDGHTPDEEHSLESSSCDSDVWNESLVAR